MKKTLNLFLIISMVTGIILLPGCKKDPNLPSLTTTEVTEITINSAISGGEITSDGGAVITISGICWSTNANPSITDSKTDDGTGVGIFTGNMTELTPNTLYYVRAYATNKAGTAYGNEVSFLTSPIGVATLSTTAITAITLTTAVSGGDITADGGGAITERGVVWATTIAPTVTNDKTSNSTGTGIYASNLSGLVPGTIYYVRAYATNSAGTVYGNELTFTTVAVTTAPLTTTAASAITLTSATLGGNITADGGSAVTARGVVYSTTAGPTITGDKTTDATGTGEFTSNLSGLTPGTLYYVRAYATNSVGTSYGNEVTFTTSPVVLATLSTTTVSAITRTTATSGGNITNDGGGAITARGVCWATTTNPRITNDKTSNATGTGSFVSNLTTLLPGTLYYVRAYATNSAGTAYGPEVTFTTSSIAFATLTTTAVTSITSSSAASGGEITADGGSAITDRGICWNTITGPTTSNSKISVGTGTGIFAGNLASLSPGTTYFVRAFATNAAGTVYGNERTFTTGAVLATLTTTAASTITATAATSGGNITSNGGGAITASGICWALTADPTTTDFKTADGTSTGSFASIATGLSGTTTYHIRAYATNSAGTAYGNDITVYTMLADNDGNLYNTRTIGTQVWMTENLKTTKYNDNTPITLQTVNATWAGLTAPAYSWYANDAATNKPLYGALYNWYAVETGKLCPTDWHVASDADYNTLELSLGMLAINADVWGWRVGTTIGTQMKNTTGWALGENGSNSSGFSALPGGYRAFIDGSFNAVGVLTYFWTSTRDGVTPAWAYYRQLNGDRPESYKGATTKSAGKYVRCVKN